MSFFSFFGTRWGSSKLAKWLRGWALTLPKFNSSPLKSYRIPIGKDRFPTTMAGRTVKLRGCIFILIKSFTVGGLDPIKCHQMSPSTIGYQPCGLWVGPGWLFFVFQETLDTWELGMGDSGVEKAFRLEVVGKMKKNEAWKVKRIYRTKTWKMRFPPKFNIALKKYKNDGWKMILSSWDGLFSGANC